jgi:mannose-6-phosphate isomerase-like protein (cupin superfamily)
MIWRVRRVLTGHDPDGKSTIIADGPAPNVKEMPSFPGLALTDLWETTSAPADNAGHADAAARPVRLEPPANGTLFRIVEFPPDSSRPKNSDGAEGFKAIGAAHAQDRHSSDPMMHKTGTVDYIVVLKGEIYAVLDKGETPLRPGDVFIQRGTNHSWSVRGKEPCIIAVVLVNARPV